MLDHGLCDCRFRYALLIQREPHETCRKIALHDARSSTAGMDDSVGQSSINGSFGSIRQIEIEYPYRAGQAVNEWNDRDFAAVITAGNQEPIAGRCDVDGIRAKADVGNRHGFSLAQVHRCQTLPVGNS